MRKWMLLTLLLLSTFAASAQTGLKTCPVFIDEALSQLGTNCADMGRNTVCYGYNRVDASFVTEVAEDFFSAPSDRAQLVSLETIQTAPLVVEQNQWGIAVMKAQVNVPGTLPGTGVTFLLLGDVSLTNTVNPEEAAHTVEPANVTIGNTTVNLRSGPGTQYNVVGAVLPGTVLQADGINEVGDWVRVSDPGGYGWVFRDLISNYEESFASLPVVTPETRAPMQAFYFSTGVGRSSCLEAPEVMVIQGPKQVRVSLNMNGTQINLGSTLAFTGERDSLAGLRGREGSSPQLSNVSLPDDRECMVTRLSVIDGDAKLQGLLGVVVTGHYTESVSCIDDSGTLTPVTEWSNPQRMTEADKDKLQVLERIPSSLLSYPITMPTEAEVETAISIFTPEQSNVGGNNSGGNSGKNNSKRPTKPGGGGDDDDDDDGGDDDDSAADEKSNNGKPGENGKGNGNGDGNGKGNGNGKGKGDEKGKGKGLSNEAYD